MPLNKHISELRKDYSLKSLSIEDIDPLPVKQFGRWWDEAIRSEVEEPNAMTLATVSGEGKPSARIVLLKGFSDQGFVFYTNYESRKAKELSGNPHACMVFFWRELERQVRIEGSVTKVSGEESDTYFSQRPEGSRIGAWSSPQSDVIPDRDLLESNTGKYQEQFKGQTIPRPPFWGGYLVKPYLMEFWQGRSNRLHDRIRYTQENENWLIARLAP